MTEFFFRKISLCFIIIAIVYRVTGFRVRRLGRMTQKDFWLNSKVAVIGAGSWGSVLANLVAPNVREVRLWSRSEEQVRSINATRVNAGYWPEMKLHERIRAMTEPERAFEGSVQAVVWALPSS